MKIPVQGSLSSSARDDLRVLIVSGLYPRSNNEACGHFVHQQALGLQRRGVDVRVLSPVAHSLVPFGGDRGFAEELSGPVADRVDSIPVLYAPYRHVPHALSANLEAYLFFGDLQDTARSLFDVEPDIVHGFWLFPAGYGSIRLAEEFGVPSVVTALGSDVHTYPERHRGTRRYSQLVLRRADLSVAVSQELERRMRRLAGAPIRSTVVYNGLDAERFHPQEDRRSIRRALGLPEDGPGICYVGRVVEEKGIDELTEAFSRLAGRRSDLWLALVGGGPMDEEIRDRVADSRFRERIFLPGRVAHAAVADWLRAADLFALPSYAEGLPNAVMEAMACGLPVVATDVGGIREIDEDRRVLRLVPPGRVEPLVEAIENSLREGPGLREAALAASRRVRERFTWERAADRLHRHYRDLLGERQASGSGVEAGEPSEGMTSAETGRGP